jgi:hypothetical protein
MAKKKLTGKTQRDKVFYIFQQAMKISLLPHEHLLSGESPEEALSVDPEPAGPGAVHPAA